jgi:hypothetical protein
MSKQWLKDNGWNALNLALLGLIATGVGYLITRTDNKLDDHEKRLNSLGVVSYNLGQNCLNTVEWQKETDRTLKDHEKEFMEIWKVMPRGGTIKTK